MTKITLALTLLLAAAGLSGCSGDDPAATCDAPIALTQGTWCITITSTSNPCGGATPGSKFWVDLTQSGSALTMTSQYGLTYAGTMCGATGTVLASAPPADVVNTILFTDADTGSGSAQWDVGSGCSGTDTFTAASGACP